MTKISDKKRKGKAEPKASNEATIPNKTSLFAKVSWRKTFVFLFKLFLVFFALLAAYTLYLDSKVVAKFEGQRWQVPVQVFGKVERFKQGDDINFAHIRESLLLNGYQRVNSPSKSGEFAASKNRLIIYRRPFDFGSGVTTTDVITIDAKNNVVTQVYIDDQPVNEVALEPILLDRIIPENKEDRVLVPLQSVPELLLDTLLIVEDRDFYFHSGVSPIGILRAAYNNIVAGRTVQGGSTLTQQLVKNMYLTRDKTITRKINEAIMALLLEYRYSKDQLLEAYINEVYLGQHYANGIYGFGLAAEFYFGKSIAQLNYGQMATLIGVIKGPSYYDPWRHEERTRQRRDLVLRLMFEHELLTKEEFVEAVKLPLAIRKQRRLIKSTLKFPAYLQLVKRELSQILFENVQQSGIRVFTGFSHYTQQMLEKTVEEQLVNLDKNNEQALQAAMVVTDIENGEIKALLGAKESGFAGFNRALSATRPIGSLIKPAIYLSALERYQQYNLATILEDKPLTITVEGEETWQPKNYDGKYNERVSLLDSLVRSLNIPSVNLGMALGLDNVAKAIHLLGYPDDIVMRPSMLLGSINMTPYEVNQFYLPIARNGFFIEGHAIDKIVSAQGETLWQFEAQEPQYISTQASYLLNYALQQVTKTGSAKSLAWRLSGQLTAGKTGTTNDQRDSWYVGFDQKTLVTTWVGNDDNNATKLTGSSGALVLYAQFMKRYGVNSINLSMPTGVSLAEFERETGYAVAQECPNTTKVPAISAGIVLHYDCSEVEINKDKPKEKSWFEKLFGN
ncbi:penicillin-binding protein 1B [Thalassotalea profundi]|uniref:Penicillin-binding protein 1B n=1 Tax=Thalassotalea profundi TaxID=2036687 RepID=A0ABQ3J0Y5_9GAMM|nr:penicillin-binding protein 1B [Thalassotalea profundi]GHE98924.1 penicillin-binding protein 1B [Thalassotalea profundi]